ncbi:hypothetical protein ACQKNB_16495 [Lysinibacillus xylanilyticus]|uniref:hypothetical protein n=1 Tax=Lysinibacillus xylanilyticus TaxID=582475 RepID=UPI003D065DFB
MDKDNILQMDLIDYIFYGGYAYLPNRTLPEKVLLEEISDEKWVTKDCIVYTLENTNWSIDFVYLSNNTYSNDSITVFPKDKRIGQFKEEFQRKYPDMKYDAFCSEEQLVFIFSNGVRVFFIKRDSDYFLSKLYGKSYLVDVEKKFIMETMKKIDL